MVRQCRLGAALVCLLVIGAHAASASDGVTKHHALSLIGTPKHGPDFTHFDWVNPDAPKGGRVRQWALGTFDSLNPFPVKGSPAVGLRLIYDTLMLQSPDEPGTAYGLVAEWVTYPADFSSATVQLRTGGAFQRRQAHHARGRDLLARDAQEGLPQHLAATSRTSSRPRRRANTRSLSSSTSRATASCRSSSATCRSCRSTSTKPWAPMASRATRQVHARDPPELGPLSHQGGRCRPHDHLRARQGLVGEGPARRQGPVELR